MGDRELQGREERLDHLINRRHAGVRLSVECQRYGIAVAGYLAMCPDTHRAVAKLPSQ